MDKISVIIPIYNVESYIRKCLDSVINQTYTNLEIICINDGSPDNCGKICDDYAKKDKRIKVFHQNNKGLSAARNIGLINSTGQYIGFVDPDDWIEPDMYEILYNTMKGCNANIGVGNVFLDTDVNSIARVNRKQIADGPITPHDMLLYAFCKEDYKGFFFACMCNKLFSSGVMNKNLPFNTNLSYSEDVLSYTNAILIEGCTGVYNNKPLYHCYQRSTSVTKSGSIDIQAQGLSVFKLIIDLLNKNGYEDLTVWIKKEYCYSAGTLVEKAKKNDDIKNLLRMQNEIKLYLNEYVEINKEHRDRLEWVYNLLNLGEVE